jgi:hypothetical protein
MNKQTIIDALRVFVNQRPGFDLGNYGTMADYRADSRKATKDRDVALKLLRDIELRDSITGEDIVNECGGGRVQIVSKDKAGTEWVGVDYFTGQYFPTEYRAAVARLCASVLWTWKREKAMPLAEGATEASAGEYYDNKRGFLSGGDWLRSSFRREYGKAIADRFFN